MSTEGLVYSHKIPLDEFCRNLIGARAYAARYFNSQVLFVSSAPELVRAVEDAHPYLDAHMDTLNDFGLSDSRYGLALRGRVARIVNLIPTNLTGTSLSLTSLTASLVRKNTLLTHLIALQRMTFSPFRMHSLPAPHRPQVAALSAKTSADVASYYATSSHYDQTTRGCEGACYSTGVVTQSRGTYAAVKLSDWLGARLRASVKRSTRLSKTAQPAPPSLDVKATRPMRGTRTSSRKSKSALPTVSTTAVAKKSGSVYVSDDVVESESGREGVATEVTTPGWDHEAVDDDIVVPPYHPVTGEPLLGLKYVSFSAFSEPVQSLSMVKSAISSKGKGKVVEQPSAVVSFAPSSSLTTDVVDNTIYSRAFHPSVDLQYHEPPSHQALESMKLSLLPAAPDSLTKPVGQIRSGREYVYRCHSDRDPYFIRPPLLNWPCFNCTLAGYPDQCVFEGGVGEECCTKCKSTRHGRCSACWDANQLRQAATLLDPLTLSGDAAICRGVQRVDRINSEIELLGRAMQSLREDREAVIREIADGLDAIACQ
ncbi:hypothetical protein IW261DRAFT_1562630 [Armillaria novae-zelandiae]|uniref:Uncharacterized protein n=1 Tax=Armillaria novae-zelandiae TaxID=153914 RepID=A0AA39PBT4_9AGAR|nr:hypothetical protein IW261DRAFT_1562630 [Armillaria novae-zelandiae]